MSDATTSHGGRLIHLNGPTPIREGAGFFSKLRLRIRELLGKALNRMGLPGAVQDLDLYDEVSGQSLTVRSSPLFTRIAVNGRDYYFRRVSGRFDGTGAVGLNRPSCCTVDRSTR